MSSIRRFFARIATLSEVRRTFASEWVVTFLILLFGWAHVLQAFVIPSGSMENSLLIGDHVLVDKLVYAPGGGVSRHLLPYREIQRGDMIVFTYPLDSNKDLVKRAIGIPGDHIRLENKQLILNGKKIDEPYVQHLPDTDYYRDNFPAYASAGLRPRALEMLARDVRDGELVVPPGFIFAMGDNRDNSDDSRFWGLVPRDYIKGKPVIIFWSFDAPGEQIADPNPDLDHVCDMIFHFFSKTRWNRTMKRLHGYPLRG